MPGPLHRPLLPVGWPPLPDIDSGGDAGPPVVTPPGGDEIDDRFLVQMEDMDDADLSVGQFRRWNRELALFWLEAVEVVRRIRESFDVDTAHGDQQDKIGGLIGLPRRGFDDERYRTFQKIQILLLLAAARADGEWTGTVPNILRICRTFVGEGAGQVLYHATPPYAFTLSIPGVESLDELDLLIYFLCRACYAGVLGVVYFALGAVSNWDSDTAGPAILNTGNWGSDTPGSFIDDVATCGTAVIVAGHGSEC